MQPPNTPPDGTSGPALELVSALAVAIAEVLTGHRPSSQLARWIDPECLDHLVIPASGWPCVKVASVRATTPFPGAIEGYIRFQVQDRSVCAALRLEQAKGRWHCRQLGLIWPTSEAQAA